MPNSNYNMIATQTREQAEAVANWLEDHYDVLCTTCIHPSDRNCWLVKSASGFPGARVVHAARRHFEKLLEREE